VLITRNILRGLSWVDDIARERLGGALIDARSDMATHHIEVALFGFKSRIVRLGYRGRRCAGERAA